MADYITNIIVRYEADLQRAKQYGCFLQLVKEQTPEICLASVQNKGLTLQYVKEQTPEICLAAVQQNGMALQYVKEQTPELCLEVAKQEARLKFIRKCIEKLN
jgi:hypothetical protein